jgi:osmotically-inducible protein OsmY
MSIQRPTSKPIQYQYASGEPTDEELSEEIHELLFDCSEIDSSHIEIEVNCGGVEINGAVPNLSMRRKTENLIQAIPGVITIKNNLSFNNKEGSSLS